MSERPPYDEHDVGKVKAYLQGRGLQLFDPLGADRHDNDAFFAPGLAAIRHQMENAFRSRRADGTPFRVYPAFVTHHLPNAFAVDLGGLHLCAMHEGLVTTVFELAAFVFSQRETFPEVGDPSVETSPELPEGALLGYWIADRLVTQPVPAEPIGLELVPIDPERRLMAHFLALMMLRFVWFHELFHGLNGHAGLLASRHVETGLVEMPELALVTVDEDHFLGDLPRSHVLRALEIDADRAAFWLTIKLQIEEDEPFEVLAGQPKALRLKLCVFAGLMMAFLFDQHARRNADRERRDHPDGALRLQNLLATLAGDGVSSGRTVFQSTRAEILRLRSRVPSLPVPASATDRSSQDVHPLLVELEADLAILRPILAGFAYLS